MHIHSFPAPPQHPRHTAPPWRAFCACALIATAQLSAALAAPLLRCHVTYAGSTQVVDSQVTNDPYSVASIDIGGRFKFKAVMVGTGQKINPVDYIKLYAYLQRRDKDFPIHQATYLPPFKPSIAPIALTPLNYLYAGEVERELQYHCTLQGVTP